MTRGLGIRVLATSITLIGGLTLVTGCAPDKQSEPTGIEGFFSSVEQQREVAECMEERGWSVEFHADSGAIVTDVGPGQDASYERDTAECSEVAGIDMSGALTNEDFALVYDWYSRIAECLEREGWSVPARPSLAAFRDTYESDPWIPWFEVPGPETADAEAACPVMKRPQP